MEKPLKDLIEEDWITLHQLTQVVGITYDTAREWVRMGKVKALLVGKSWRIYESELKRLLHYGTRPNDPTLNKGKWKD